MNKKKNDRALFLAIILVAFVWLLVRNLTMDKGNSITIMVDGEKYGTYLLTEEQTISLNEGKNRVVIKDGQAYMEHAKCPDQLCIQQGAIQYQGESIICLPNKVTVTVDGKSKTQYDGVTG